MFRFAFAAVLVALLVVVPADSRAADGDEPTYEIGLYVWGAMIAGDVDTPEGEASAHIPFSDVWDNLNMALMGRARANFDKFSVVFDGEYFDLQSDREQRTVRLGPAGNVKVPASVQVKMQLNVLELNGGYEVFRVKGPFSYGPHDERGTVGELYLGARYFAVKPDIIAKVGAERRDIGEWTSWVDGIVGARIGIDLSRTVMLGIQGDVGGFNIGQSNKFAWSQITSLSWDFTDNMTFSLGYKFLDIKHEPSSDKTIDLQLRGPFIATFYRF
jgi:opacity protein-like surface antigen